MVGVCLLAQNDLLPVMHLFFSGLLSFLYDSILKPYFQQKKSGYMIHNKSTWENVLIAKMIIRPYLMLIMISNTYLQLKTLFQWPSFVYYHPPFGGVCSCQSQFFISFHTPVTQVTFVLPLPLSNYLNMLLFKVRFINLFINLNVPEARIMNFVLE